jgi:hypothetical protein
VTPQILSIPDRNDLADMMEGELALRLELQEPSLAHLVDRDGRLRFELAGVVLVTCVRDGDRTWIAPVSDAGRRKMNAS